MTRTAALVCVGAIAALATGAAAQEKPNFAGRWSSDAASTPAGRGGRGAGVGDAGSGWGPVISITQVASQLTIEYAFFTRGDMQPPLRFVYALDGTETKNSVMMGRGVQVETSKASWDGDTLVITTLFPFTNPSTGQPMTSEVKRTLSLASPASLVVETVRVGVPGGPSSTTRTVYTKSS